jgi:catechol 2,3-dioxygenase-like lactoylglutathione lyase family enzyme
MMSSALNPTPALPRRGGGGRKGGSHDPISLPALRGDGQGGWWPRPETLMPGGIDHLVLCARDLEAARAFYARLGFTLTPLARHPFGTGNSLVQLKDRSFLELLTVMDAAAIPPMRPGYFSFAAYNRDFLARQEGCSMLVLESFDAAADARSFRAAGLGDFEPFHFERPAKLPDGSVAKVAFSLAFAVHPAMPEAVFFSCRQHAPELFWKPDYQRHENGAAEIDEVALVAADPLSLAGTLEAVTGIPAASASDGLLVRTARGSLRALAPAAFARRYAGAEPPPLDRGPRLAGCRLSVEDLPALRSRLAQSGLRFSEGQGSLVIPPGDAFGLALAFVQRSKP